MRFVLFPELLQTSDIISLHVPLSEATRGMMGAREFETMKRSAILINTCRGPVVDEFAVKDILDAGKLWGYAADVFDVEPPPPDHPLIGRPDCLFTPHSAAQTVESLINMSSWVAEDVVGILRGEPARNPVNDPAEVVATQGRRSESVKGR